MLIVAGDHSRAPPSAPFDTGLLSPFQLCIVGWCNPRWITKGFPFHAGARPSRRVAGALWSCQGEGTFFPGEGTPVPLTFTGAFCWEASQAQVNGGTIVTCIQLAVTPQLPVDE